MTGKTQRKRIIALLLSVVLFGAEFHICTDLTLDLTSSPVCQLCSTASSVVVPPCPGIAIIPSTNRIEVLADVVPVSLDFPTAISPRAPPIF
jgi:hypothetical protein